MYVLYTQTNLKYDFTSAELKDNVSYCCFFAFIVICKLFFSETTRPILEPNFAWHEFLLGGTLQIKDAKVAVMAVFNIGSYRGKKLFS